MRAPWRDVRHPIQMETTLNALAVGLSERRKLTAGSSIHLRGQEVLAGTVADMGVLISETEVNVM